MATMDRLIPKWDARSRHERLVNATPAAVYDAIERFRPRDDSAAWVRALLLVRGVPVGKGALRESLARGHFRPVIEDPGHEIVFAVAGKFWAIRERAALEHVDSPKAVTTYDEPGKAVAAFALRVEPHDGGSLLVTETRVRCVDATARSRFTAYWRVVGPFSGLIRRDWLRGIARLAENAEG